MQAFNGWPGRLGCHAANRSGSPGCMVPWFPVATIPAPDTVPTRASSVMQQINFMITSVIMRILCRIVDSFSDNGGVE